MTDISAQAEIGFSSAPPTFSMEEMYWGYIVRAHRAPVIGLLIAQLVCYFVGACLLTAAVGLWVLPNSLVGGVETMRMGATVLFAALAAYLLWFASRGSRPELHVDNSLGEIREVVRNRAGRPTIISAYSFDTIGGILLEHHEGDELASLVLRYRNTASTVAVAEGTEAQLIGLRDRLGRDLMVEPKTSSTLHRGMSRAA